MAAVVATNRVRILNRKIKIRDFRGQDIDVAICDHCYLRPSGRHFAKDNRSFEVRWQVKVWITVPEPNIETRDQSRAQGNGSRRRRFSCRLRYVSHKYKKNYDESERKFSSIVQHAFQAVKFRDMKPSHTVPTLRSTGSDGMGQHVDLRGFETGEPYTYFIKA